MSILDEMRRRQQFGPWSSMRDMLGEDRTNSVVQTMNRKQPPVSQGAFGPVYGQGYEGTQARLAHER